MEWEYRCNQFGWLVDWKDDSNSITKFLNKYGANGWELVGQKEVLRQDFKLAEGYKHSQFASSKKYETAWIKDVRNADGTYPFAFYGEKIYWMFFFKRPKN